MAASCGVVAFHAMCAEAQPNLSIQVSNNTTDRPQLPLPYATLSLRWLVAGSSLSSGGVHLAVAVAASGDDESSHHRQQLQHNNGRSD